MADKTAERQPAQLANDMTMAASQLSAMVDDELQDMESDWAPPLESRSGGGIAGTLSPDQQRLTGSFASADRSGFAARIRQAIETDPLPLPVVKPLPTWHKR